MLSTCDVVVSLAVVAAQAEQDKDAPPKAEDAVRLYESLMGSVKELSENAARLGGATGEILLEECTAKVRLYIHTVVSSLVSAFLEIYSPWQASEGACFQSCLQQ